VANTVQTQKDKIFLKLVFLLEVVVKYSFFFFLLIAQSPTSSKHPFFKLHSTQQEIFIYLRHSITLHGMLSEHFTNINEFIFRTSL